MLCALVAAGSPYRVPVHSRSVRHVNTGCCGRCALREVSSHSSGSLVIAEVALRLAAEDATLVEQFLQALCSRKEAHSLALSLLCKQVRDVENKRGACASRLITNLSKLSNLPWAFTTSAQGPVVTEGMLAVIAFVARSSEDGYGPIDQLDVIDSVAGSVSGSRGKSLSTVVAIVSPVLLLQAFGVR